MNKTLLTILMLALLLLFIISPFAALASLMLIVFVSAFLSLLGNLFQAIIGSDTNPKGS
ncbi:hypothetical protein [Nostoc sp.]|uniref:hypothetical protein n=1 Tax=Nostoc sp. TaxID=1180 RepID=UPI002FFB1E7D